MSMPSARRNALIAVTVALPIVAGGWILQERATRDGARLFDQVLSLVSDRFVDTVGTAALYEKAAKGLVDQLNDPYSELLSPKAAERFSATSTGRYGGVGMQIEKQQENIVVVRVFPNTPAERAGIVEGDRIAVVDTMSTRGWSTQQVSDVLLGAPGTKVRARFSRPGVAQPIDHHLTRAIIRVPAVPYAIMLDGNIGYLPLLQFNESASQDVAAAADRLVKQGARGIIVDVRDNPGGILEQALSISDVFLNNGQEIASVRGRDGAVQKFKADGRQHFAGIPLVVMVNGYSASASEIVAGSLQDHDRALVVGTTSYGKGLVQSVFPLEGGYSLKLTTAKWYTPSGRSIQKDRTPARPGTIVAGARAPQPDEEETPDSLEQESVKKDRPTFRSDAGRIVYGGGGITPDVIVPEDTISTAEQDFARALAPKGAIVRAALYDMALSLKGKITPDIQAKPEWRAEFLRRLEKDSVAVNPKQFQAATALVDRWITHQAIRQSFGDSTLFRRTISEDPQMLKALELIRKGHTQQDLFTLARASIK
ncbi:MAG: PDZ domain-containing protein [Anaerolineae bacterium]|nr:PDZ domain-containing protein [Gemmatimonadaceae bacterium]